MIPENATYTAAEVKVLTETATKLGRALGRKEACDEAIDRLSELAHRIAPGNPHPVLGRDTVVRYLRDIASQPAQAASDATSGVPRHSEVSEAARSPQEPGEPVDLAGALRKAIDAARERRLAEAAKTPTASRPQEPCGRPECYGALMHTHPEGKTR